MTDECKLGRFGHHPESEIDWSLECEELENVITNLSLGLSGFGHEEEYDQLGHRLSKFLDFATRDTHILDMKRQLRGHITRLGFTMSPKWYEGAPVLLYRTHANIDEAPRGGNYVRAVIRAADAALKGEEG